ncbi:MAG: hypothetical protein ACK6EB_09975, partial [Planctomyces sp.]
FHDIAATAIEQGWSVEKTELEALKRQTSQNRTRPTSFSAAQGNGDQTRILQAALSAARGHKADKHFTDAELQAAFSTVSLPGIFSNLANKELLAGFEEEDNNWEEISDVKSVSDFKTHTSYRLNDEMEYEELGPGGVMKHGKISEESYNRSADTYA